MHRGKSEGRPEGAKRPTAGDEPREFTSRGEGGRVPPFFEKLLKIYRIEEGKIALEWTLSPEGWGPSDAVWRGDDSRIFTKNFQNGKTAPGNATFNPKAKKWDLKK